MISLVIHDKDLKQDDTDILEVHTQPQTNKLPFKVVLATHISEIGTLNDVPPDGNCFFTSLWNAMCDLNQSTEHLDVTKHRHILHSFAFNNWKSIVSNVLHGGDGKGVKYYFNISNTQIKMQYLEDNVKTNKTISKIVQEYHDWYTKQICDVILDPNELDRDYNSAGAKISQYGDVHVHAPILALHYKKTICAYLSGEQGNSGTFIAIYNRLNETVTSWYHKGFIFPPDINCLLIWHTGSAHFKWIKHNDTIVRPKNLKKKQSVLTFGQLPISTTLNQSSRSQEEIVTSARKKRKIGLPEYVPSVNEFTKKETAISTSSRSTIQLSIPTKTTKNEIDAQMVLESDLELCEIKLKNIKIESELE